MNAVRIAMWSGPRNISTALMRAWENRSDTVVIDEPFYAFYLNETHAEHPGADEVIAAGETDARKVVAQLLAPPPNDARVFYQKQMTHHLLPQVDRSWLAQVTSCFLIRDPAHVIASYTKKNHAPTATDIGFPQQLDIFEAMKRLTNRTPPIVDADDILRDPRRMLSALCDAVGVEFSEAMLLWPAGRREADGIWAKYWYAEVERSTGFAPFAEREVKLPRQLHDVHDECRAIYEELYALRIR